MNKSFALRALAVLLFSVLIAFCISGCSSCGGCNGCGGGEETTDPNVIPNSSLSKSLEIPESATSVTVRSSTNDTGYEGSISDPEAISTLLRALRSAPIAREGQDCVDIVGALGLTLTDGSSSCDVYLDQNMVLFEDDYVYIGAAHASEIYEIIKSSVK